MNYINFIELITRNISDGLHVYSGETLYMQIKPITVNKCSDKNAICKRAIILTCLSLFILSVYNEPIFFIFLIFP